jgi:hypothetical protein
VVVLSRVTSAQIDAEADRVPELSRDAEERALSFGFQAAAALVLTRCYMRRRRRARDYRGRETHRTALMDAISQRDRDRERRIAAQRHYQLRDAEGDLNAALNAATTQEQRGLGEPDDRHGSPHVGLPAASTPAPALSWIVTNKLHPSIDG